MKQFLFSTGVAPVIFAGALMSANTPAQAQTARAENVPKIGGVGEAKITVAGVSVTGLNATEAQRRLRRELEPKLNASVFLSDGHRRLPRRRRDLGVSLDIGWMVGRAMSGQKFVPLRFRVDSLAMQRALRRAAPNFTTQARDARVVENKGTVKIVPESVASRVLAPASAHHLASLLEENASLRVLKLTTKETAPTLTAARLKGIDGRLSTFATGFNAGKEKRTLNMRLAIRAINGTLLSPGEVFSLNKAVGERTQARGYRTSIIFQNGYKVPGIGAGVSQVTGTLFNAALLAGLPIVTYRTHSQPVTYLPIGRDATVSWGNFDMKFKNNTGAPIYISYGISGERATATLFGKKTPDQKVSLTVRSQNRSERHITAQLYRTIRQNGKVTSKQRIGTSTYKWNVGAWEE
jgi:vancomycin resistance protein YoaR